MKISENIVREEYSYRGGGPLLDVLRTSQLTVDDVFDTNSHQI